MITQLPRRIAYLTYLGNLVRNCFKIKFDKVE